MASPGDLTTLGSVKLYLGLTTGAADDKLATIISAASAWMETYMNRIILSAAYTETLNGTGGRQIMTANYPVTDIAQVLVDGADVTAQAVTDGRRTITLMPPSAVNSTPWNYPNIFPRNIMNVVLSYTAGFAVVPFDLEHVACRIVAWGYNESSRLQQVSKSMGGEVVSFSQLSVPNWAKDSLTNWKKVI